MRTGGWTPHLAVLSELVGSSGHAPWAANHIEFILPISSQTPTIVVPGRECNDAWNFGLIFLYSYLRARISRDSTNGSHAIMQHRDCSQVPARSNICILSPHPSLEVCLSLSFNLIFSGFWKGLRNDYEWLEAKQWIPLQHRRLPKHHMKMFCIRGRA